MSDQPSTAAQQPDQPMHTYRVVVADPILAKFLSDVAVAYERGLEELDDNAPSDCGLIRLMNIDLGNLSYDSLMTLRHPILRTASIAAAAGLLQRFYGELAT